MAAMAPSDLLVAAAVGGYALGALWLRPRQAPHARRRAAALPAAQAARRNDRPAPWLRIFYPPWMRDRHGAAAHWQRLRRRRNQPHLARCLLRLLDFDARPSFMPRGLGAAPGAARGAQGARSPSASVRRWQPGWWGWRAPPRCWTWAPAAPTVLWQRAAFRLRHRPSSRAGAALFAALAIAFDAAGCCADPAGCWVPPLLVTPTEHLGGSQAYRARACWP